MFITIYWIRLSLLIVTYFNKDYLTVHWASDNGYFDIVKNLVDITEDKNPWDKNGNRPLHYAAKKGHFNTMKYLVDKEVKSHIPGLYKINDRNPGYCNILSW